MEDIEQTKNQQIKLPNGKPLDVQNTVEFYKNFQWPQDEKFHTQTKQALNRIDSCKDQKYDEWEQKYQKAMNKQQDNLNKFYEYLLQNWKLQENLDKNFMKKSQDYLQKFKKLHEEKTIIYKEKPNSKRNQGRVFISDIIKQTMSKILAKKNIKCPCKSIVRCRCLDPKQWQ